METAIVGFSLTLSRVAAIVGLVPIFGGSQVPRLVRVGIAVALTLVWWPTVTDPVLAGVYRRASENALFWLLLVGREVLIGLGLALAMRLVLAPARIAGEWIAQEMMLSFAATTAPGSETPSTLFGQFFEMAALALFFSMDGHHVMLAVIHTAWANWPIGDWSLWPTGDWLAGVRVVMEAGVQLALPATACLFLLGLALALWARAAPALNLLALGFVVRVLGGLVAVYVFSPVVMVGLIQALQNMTYWLASYGR
jgi:flagellar biosynthetic protein FliR